jgi:hypothetical protein
MPKPPSGRDIDLLLRGAEDELLHEPAPSLA